MWAILGTSKIAEFMVDAIKEAGDDVLSVYTHSNQERLKGFAERFHIPHKFLTIEEAFSVKGVKAVWVGTPNQAHAQACLAAFANDTIEIVLSEKSLERSLEGAQQIEQGYKNALMSRQKRGIKTPLIFREALFYLNHPIMQKFHSFLQSQALGEVKLITAEYSRDLSRLTHPDGGGAIYNLGVYPVSLVHMTLGTLFGDAVFHKRRLRAFAYIQTDKGCQNEKNRDYVAESTAVIDFQDTIRATITTCEVSQSKNSNAFEVIGSKGSVIFRSNPYSPERGLNQFDFIDTHGNTTSYTTTTNRGAYAYQILMTKHDLVMQREIAARPTASLSDSMSIMEFLSQWEKAAVLNPESTRLPLARRLV